MTDAPKDPAGNSAPKHVTVAVNIPGRGYVTAGMAIVDDDRGVHGFVYSKRYTQEGLPPLDPINLDYKAKPDGRFKLSGSKTLHEVFIDSMPGRFAMDLLMRRYPDMRRMTDAARFHFLGTRKANGFLLGVADEYANPEPAKTLHDLDAFRDEALKVRKRELGTISPHYQAGLRVSDGGARPKWMLEGEDGGQWLAKFAEPHDPYDSTKLEALSLALMYKAGVPSPSAMTKTLPSGEPVLLIRRYDIEGGRRMHKVSMASLIDTQSGGDYRDMAKALRQVSAKPEQDLPRLFKSMLLDAALHNVDNHARNFELLLTEGGYRLSPQFDKLPEPGRSAGHSTSFAGLPHLDVLDDKAVARVAEAFGFSREQGLVLRDQVTQAFGALPKLIREMAVRDHDVDQLLDAIGQTSPRLAKRVSEAMGQTAQSAQITEQERDLSL